MLSEWERRPTILGVIEPFWPRSVQNIFGNQIVAKGPFLPILEIHFVAEIGFPPTQKSYCVVGAYFGFGLS